MDQDLFSWQTPNHVVNDLVLLFPTNQMNLQEIMSSGLLKPLEGFPEQKYYADVLKCCPGRLPLFVDHVPREAWQDAVSEPSFVTPVILKIDASSLSGGPVACLHRNGELAATALPLKKNDRPAVLLWPGVLPVSLVTAVYFSDKSIKDVFLREARQISNLNPDFFQYRTNKDFKKLTTKSMAGIMDGLRQTALTEAAPKWSDYLRTEACGGVITHLYQTCSTTPSLSPLIDHVFRIPPADIPVEIEIPAPLRVLPAWLRGDARSETLESKPRILAALLDLLSIKQAKEDPPVKSIINVLEEQATKMEEKAGTLLSAFIQRLKRLAEFGDEPAESFLNDSRSPLINGLFLFVLRKNSRELLEPMSGLPIRDSDLMMARLLCGAWEGWTALTAADRGEPDLQKAICHSMAALHNHRHGLTIQLGPAPLLPPPPISLRDLFGRADWTRKIVQTSALEICQKMRWNCISTVISLPRGEYTLKVSGGSLELHVGAFCQPVYSVSREEFERYLDMESVNIPTDLAKSIQMDLA